MFLGLRDHETDRRVRLTGRNPGRMIVEHEMKEKISMKLRHSSEVAMRF